MINCGLFIIVDYKIFNFITFNLSNETWKLKNNYSALDRIPLFHHHQWWTKCHKQIIVREIHQSFISTLLWFVLVKLCHENLVSILVTWCIMECHVVVDHCAGDIDEQTHETVRMRLERSQKKSPKCTKVIELNNIYDVVSLVNWIYDGIRSIYNRSHLND